MASLQTLPEELLVHLTKFMPGKDIINLSHTCQRFSKVLQSDFLWSGLFMRGNLIKASDISQYAATVSKDENSDRGKPLFWFRSKPKPNSNRFRETKPKPKPTNRNQFFKDWMK